jgi:hypothetical protein
MKIKAYAIMNKTEKLGHNGILWYSHNSLKDDFVPLAIFSTEEQAEKALEIMDKDIPKKVVEINLKTL